METLFVNLLARLGVKLASPEFGRSSGRSVSFLSNNVLLGFDFVNVDPLEFDLFKNEGFSPAAIDCDFFNNAFRVDKKSFPGFKLLFSRSCSICAIVALIVELTSGRSHKGLTSPIEVDVFCRPALYVTSLISSCGPRSRTELTRRKSVGVEGEYPVSRSSGLFSTLKKAFCLDSRLVLAERLSIVRVYSDTVFLFIGSICASFKAAATKTNISKWTLWISMQISLEAFVWKVTFR